MNEKDGGGGVAVTVAASLDFGVGSFAKVCTLQQRTTKRRIVFIRTNFKI